MQPLDLQQATLTGVRWTVAARVALQLLTWPMTLLVVRLLDPGDYGLFAMAIFVTGFVTLFGELGLDVALVQANAVPVDVARGANAVLIAANLGFALLLCALAPWLADIYGNDDVELLIQVLALTLPVMALSVVPQAMLERRLRFRALSIAQLGAGFAGTATTLVAAWFDAGVWALVAGTLVLAATRSLLMVAFHGGLIRPAWPRRAGLQPLVRISGHVAASRALWGWTSQADILLLGRMLQTVPLGLYSMASQLAMLPVGKAMEGVNRVAYPVLARAQVNPEALRRSHRQMVGMGSLFGFGVCWGLAAVAPEFVLAVLGAKWRLAATPLMLLALVAPLRMLCAIHNTMASATGSPQAVTKELMLAGLLMPSAAVLGAWWNGPVGAALGWLLVFPVVYLVSNHFTCRALRQPALAGMRPLVAPLGAGLCMLLVVEALRRGAGSLLTVHGLLAAEIVTGALVYGGVIWVAARPLALQAWNATLSVLRPARTPP